MEFKSGIKRFLTDGTFVKTTRAVALGVSLLAGTSALVAPSVASAEMVFNRGNGSEPGTLDPQISEGVPSAHILRDLFEGLTAEHTDGSIIPGQAESWTISEDGKTFVFKIRDNAKWSNGDPVTAHDFVYAWQRAVAPATGTAYSFLLYPLENAQAISSGEEKDLSKLGVKATDDRTLEVKLSGPAPYFLGMITHSVAYPVHKGTVEAKGASWTRPENMVSNGAFKLQEWTPQSRIVAVKSDTYWNKDTVQLDKVVYYPTESQTTALKRYRAGELDWTYEVPNDQIKWIKENMADEFHVSNYLGTYYYGFNMTKPPFNDPKLRKAFSMAIDRDILTSKIVTAGEVPAYAFVVPGVTGYDAVYSDFKAKDQAARNAEALKLYEEAGYSKDNPIEIELRYNTSDNHKKIAIAVASMWKKTFGAKVNLVNEEWKVYLETRKLKEATQAFRAGWIGDYNDPNTFLELWLSDSGLNDTGFDNPEFDSLLKQAGLEQDATKRKELLMKAEAIFLEANAVAPIYHYVTKRMVKPYVKGWQSNVMDHIRSQYITIEK
ncbi:peptide ABC transporter substrate-binding protein [uncultured Kiloniella sp.]|uniref:peptide ABC transporter substrate-binding protein n=1 Tax=uncultured Kiloniella sp. TaxID=1133091 RepID=UPI002613F1F1|nr:peptide ABC transporter substrate-binding protein [uncultured Kiloniella sp.]